jgi:hypothetical protein
MSEFEIFGEKNYVTLITNLEVKDWGQTVILHGSVDPKKTNIYRVLCSGCEKIRCFFYEYQIDRLEDDILDVLDFNIQDKSNKKKVPLYAHLIELYVTCENIKLKKKW